MRHSYSMPPLPSALRAMKACRPPCESTSKTLGLGPRIFPNFAEAIRAYAIFAAPRDASFRFGVFRPESNRQPIAFEAIALPLSH